MGSVEKKALNGVFWNAFEVISTKGIAFVVGVIIARILLPEDFGVVAIANVFISFGQVFLVSGFISALIQKKEVSAVEYSSVFYFNIVLGVFLYVLFFFMATGIAAFYEQEELTLIIRVLSLNILINSFFIVQFAITMKNMEFRRLAIINISTGIVAGTGGVLAAYNGFGLWAIVIQACLNSLTALILFWLFSDWRPIWAFSKKGFLGLYNYAYKMFLNVALKNVFDNLYNLVIGRYYTMKELGFYSKAFDLQKLPVNTIYQMVSKVSFSYFSKIQDEEQKYLKAFNLIYNGLGFIIIPVMSLLILSAPEIISLLLTDKWLPSTPFFRLLCCCGMIIPLSSMISNTLEAKGMATVTLKITVFEKILMITALFFTINLGINQVILGFFMSLFIAFCIKVFVIKKALNTSAIYLMKKIILNLIIAVLLGIGSYLLVEKYLDYNNFITIIIKSSLFAIGFLSLSYLFKSLPLSLQEFKLILNQYRSKT